jgi:small subunit ribosomal protein S16
LPGLAHLSGPLGWSPAGAGPPLRIYRWEKTTAVAVKIKLKRLGKIREPYYRIVVADSRTKRDGRAIEEIGKYHPKAEPSFIEVNSERVQHWLSVGAQPTDPVRVLLKVTGDWQKFRGEPGSEGTLRVAKPRGDKKEAFDVAAKASQASKEKDEKASAKGGPRAKSAAGSKAKATSAKAETAPAETAPAEDAPAKAEDAPAKAKAETAPAKAKAETAPAEAKAETAPAEDAPAKAEDATAKGEDATAKAEDAPASAQAEAAPAEAAPAEAAPAEETPAASAEAPAEAAADAGTEA